MSKHTPGPQTIRAAGPSGSEVDLSTLTPTDLRRWYDRAVRIKEFEGDFETFHELVTEGRIEVEHYNPPEQLMSAIGRMRSLMMFGGVNAYEISEILSPICTAPDQIAELKEAAATMDEIWRLLDDNTDGPARRAKVIACDAVLSIRKVLAKAEPKGEDNG